MAKITDSLSNNPTEFFDFEKTLEKAAARLEYLGGIDQWVKAPLPFQPEGFPIRDVAPAPPRFYEKSDWYPSTYTATPRLTNLDLERIVKNLSRKQKNKLLRLLSMEGGTGRVKSVEILERELDLD